METRFADLERSLWQSFGHLSLWQAARLSTGGGRRVSERIDRARVRYDTNVVRLPLWGPGGREANRIP